MITTMDRTDPWYRHRWPWLLMAGPLLAIVAGSYAMWLAHSGADALVVGDYYKQGKAINQDLRRDRVATSLGLGVALVYDAQRGRLTGTMLQHGLALQAPLALHLIHATQPARDIHLQASVDAQGRFSVELPMLDQSRWQVLVEDTGRSWRLEGGWSWPAQRSIAIAALPQ